MEEPQLLAVSGAVAVVGLTFELFVIIFCYYLRYHQNIFESLLIQHEAMLLHTSMQQKKSNNKGEEPRKINASFTNPKIEEETKQQGKV